MRPIALIPLLLAATSFAQAPEWQPDANGVWEIGYGPQPPRLVHAALAVVPADAPSGNATSCFVSAVSAPDGSPTQVREVGGCPRPFASAAVAAVQQSRFEPGTHNGQPVPVRIALWVPFTPDHPDATPEIIGSRTRRRDPDSTPPRALSFPPAEYSKKARRAKLQGIVTVTGIITDEGLPIDLHIVSGLGMGLDEKALECVARYRFDPATREGKAVPAPLNVQVNFRLY